MDQAGAGVLRMKRFASQWNLREAVTVGILRESQKDKGESSLDKPRPFRLRKPDRLFLRSLAQGLRILLRVNDIRPEAIVGLARALRHIERLPDITPGTDVEVVLDFDSSGMSTSTTIHLSIGRITAEKSGGSESGFGFESFDGFYYKLSVDGDQEIEGSMSEFASEFVANCEAVLTSPRYSLAVFDHSEPGPLQPSSNEN